MITLALANKNNMVVKWIHVETSKEQLPRMESIGELNSHCLQLLRCVVIFWTEYILVYYYSY